MQQYFWRIFNMFEETIFLLMAYFTRNIQKEYSLCKETCIMTAINIFYFNIVHVLPHLINFSGVCIGPLPFLFVIKDLRHVLVAMLVTLYPLSICEISHIPLPPSLALESVDLMIAEEKLFVVFYRFLLSLDAMSKQQGKNIIEFYLKLEFLIFLIKFDILKFFFKKKKKKKIIFFSKASKYLRFYLDIKMIGENRQNGRNQLEPAYYHYLQEEYLKYFEDWEEETRILSEKNQAGTLIFDDLRDCFDLARQKLNFFYRDFQNTKSFEFLLEKMHENDEINARLYDFNILKKI